jgi:cytochrome c-type biogenesis protein CcmF
MGAFLVRSGVLSSVHAFAVDPKRGVFILAIMVVFIGGALTLYAWRAPGLRQGGIFAPISREGGLVLNNVLLTTATGTVLVGTLYPLALESINGAKISVGPPYFNATFVPLMVPLLLALPFGPLMGWKRGDIHAALQRLWIAGLLAIVAIVAVFAVVQRGPWLAPFALAVGVWVVAGAVSELLTRVKAGTADRLEIARRLRNLPRSVYGTTVAHAGVGVMVIGITATSAWQSEQVLTMKPGETARIAGYELTFKGVAPRDGPNYREVIGVMSVARAGQPIVDLAPSKRQFTAPQQTTSEAGIHVALLGDLYVVLGDEAGDGAYAVRMYFNPLVRLIWIGAIIMFIGGALSLSDRRLRVGAPRRSRRREPAAVPAE